MTRVSSFIRSFMLRGSCLGAWVFIHRGYHSISNYIITFSVTSLLSFAPAVLTSCASSCTFHIHTPALLSVWTVVLVIKKKKLLFLISFFLFALFAPHCLFLSVLNTPLFIFSPTLAWKKRKRKNISQSTHKQDLLTKRQTQIDWLSRRGDRLPIGVTQHRALIPHPKTKPTYVTIIALDSLV